MSNLRLPEWEPYQRGKLMLKNGSYVCHKKARRTRCGTISDGVMHNGKMSYIFHLDPRFKDADALGEVSYWEHELVECERPSDSEITEITRLLQPVS
jgi:hypothetical protein